MVLPEVLVKGWKLIAVSFVTVLFSYVAYALVVHPSVNVYNGKIYIGNSVFAGSSSQFGQKENNPSNISFNIPAFFNSDMYVKGKLVSDGELKINSNVTLLDHTLDLGSGTIRASNIINTITSGEGIAVEGGSNPKITNTGVTSLQGQVGPLSLIPGAGISIDGLTISANGRTANNYYNTYITNTGSQDVSLGTAGPLSFNNATGILSIKKASSNDDGYLSKEDFDRFSNGAGLNFTSGLLRNNDTVMNTLVSGLAGGQTITGGTGSGDSLTLESTSHSSKGSLKLNPNGGNVGIGVANPAATLDLFGTFKISQTNLGRLGNFRISSDNQAQLPTAKDSHSSQVMTINGVTYLYLIGGENYPGNYAETLNYKGTIDSSGNVASWTAVGQAALPSPSSYNATASISLPSGNYLYNIAGGNGNSDTNLIFKGTLDANGNMTTWTSAGQATLPENTDSHTAIAITIGSASYLYVVGGCGSVTGCSSPAVYRAPIDANGNVGSFTTSGQAQLPDPNDGLLLVHFKIGTKHYLYTVGGCQNVECYTEKVYKSEIDANGNVGSWTSVGQGTLPGGNGWFTGAGVDFGGARYIYTFGGCSNTVCYTNAVYRASVDDNGDVSNFSNVNQDDMPVADGYNSANTAVVASQNFVYILGGYHNGASRTYVYKGYFTSSDYTPLTVDSSGRVGIGTASPAYDFDVNGEARIQNIKTSTITAANPSLDLSLTPGSGITKILNSKLQLSNTYTANQGEWKGFVSNFTFNTAAQTGYNAGISSQATFNAGQQEFDSFRAERIGIGTADMMGAIVGFRTNTGSTNNGYVLCNNATCNANMIAGMLISQNEGVESGKTFNVTLDRGVYVAGPNEYNYGGTLNITSRIGMQIGGVGSGATVNNNYGLMINDQTNGGTGYSIFSDGGKSYFKDNVGFGDSGPQQKISVNGNIQLDGYGNMIGFNPADVSTYDSKTMGNYSLGWYQDTWTGNGPTAWLSGWGGLKFFTDGTPRLAIQGGTGNIGIGTTSPSAAKLQFAASTAASGGISFGGDTNLYRTNAGVLRSDNSIILGSRNFSLGNSGDLGVTGHAAIGNLSNVTGQGSALQVSDQPTTNANSRGLDVLQVGDPTTAGLDIAGASIVGRNKIGNTFNVNGIYGVSSFASLQSSVTASFINSVNASMSVTAGTATNVYLYDTSSTVVGAVGTMYGLRINDPSGAGTVGTNYGIYIANQTKATTNYAIYALGGTNYFGGKVGVGLNNPTFKLSSQDTQNSSVVDAITNLSTTDSSSTGALRINLGTASSGTSSRFVQFYAGSTTDANGTGVGRIRLNNAGVAYETGGADFAEYFDMIEETKDGDIITMTREGNRKSRNSEYPLGVVSSTAGFVGNAKQEKAGEKQAIVGLVGQIKVKVSTIHGDIHKGDPIGLSDLYGRGALLIEDGYVIGTALEDFSKSSKEPCEPNEMVTVEQLKGITCGAIIVYVYPQWKPIQKPSPASIAKSPSDLKFDLDVQSIKAKTLETAVLLAHTATIEKLVVEELEVKKVTVVTNGKNELIGSATVPANTTTFDIENTSVQADSKIFVTITSPGKQSIHVVKKTAKTGFTVELSEKSPQAVTFDYWIIQTKE